MSEDMIVNPIAVIESLRPVCASEGNKLRYDHKEEIETLELNEIPEGFEVIVMVPNVYGNICHSKTCHLLWDAFETVINKMSNKNYSDDSKRKASMNTMLFNELCKRGIMIRLGRR